MVYNKASHFQQPNYILRDAVKILFLAITSNPDI